MFDFTSLKGCVEILLLENTFDRKRISAKPNPNSNFNLKPKAQ